MRISHQNKKGRSRLREVVDKKGFNSDYHRALTGKFWVFMGGDLTTGGSTWKCDCVIYSEIKK